MIPLNRVWIGLVLASLPFAISSCGPEIIIAPRGDGGAGETSTSSSSSSSSSGSLSKCILDDVSTWETENFNAGGDHPRFATATSGVPWVALAVQNGNIVLEKLGVDDQGIVVLDKFEIPESPVYPLAFDANDKYFVLLSTTGNNWNGSFEIWVVDRASSSVLRGPVGDPADPNYTIYAALGLIDDGIALGYGRPANNEGAIELRNENLDVLDSYVTLANNFQGVWRNSKQFDIYYDKNQVAEIQSGKIQPKLVVEAKEVIGGLGEFEVTIGDQIRLSNTNQSWAGPWPHTQISKPAIVRTFGNTAAFALETELTGVVGYPKGDVLDWLRIESLPQASGIGVAVMPVIEDRRLGLFYVGLEIPHPEQPLRYYGRICR